jgi:hypothetical protein
LPGADGRRDRSARGARRLAVVLTLALIGLAAMAGAAAEPPELRHAATAAAAEAPPVRAAARSPFPWRRRVAQARRWAAGRRGEVSFAVIDPRGVMHTQHASRRFPSASVVKALLLVAYLDRPGVRHRALDRGEKRLLAPMIRTSDNDAASRVYAIVGSAGLARVARRARLRNFAPSAAWGSTTITAADMARFFWRLDTLLPRRHGAFAKQLLRTVVPSQRWGVPRARPAGWRTYLKGGWRGSLTHQAALLRRGRKRIAIAVLTAGPGTEYGHATIRGVAARAFFGLNRHRLLPAARRAGR